MRLSGRQKEILKAVGKVILVTGIALVAPNALKLFDPRNKNQKRQYRRSLNQNTV